MTTPDPVLAATTAETKRQPCDPVAELVEAATLYMVAHPCHASEGPCETERRLDVAIRVAKEAKR
jgi:hypothetical protein